MSNDKFIANRPVDIVLTEEAVRKAAKSVHGLTYKGFGVLSGNATSSLLMDYKVDHPDMYWNLVKTLFGGLRPMMNTIKVEMGNDRNNSTGAEPATMRERDEYPVVAREPGFQLAADASLYNPDIHLSILRWSAPTWVRDTNDVYHWYKNTILAVYRRYGIMVDSVNPDVNERTADLDWIVEFAQRIRTDDTGFEGNGPDDANNGWVSDTERELFRRIKVITSDEEVTGTFAGDVLAVPEYLESMDVAAYHYSVEDDQDGNFTRLADEYDKEIWNSEAQAVFSNSADRPNNTNGDGLTAAERDKAFSHARASDSFGEYANTGIGGQNGPLEMANTLIKGFVCSRRTHAIYQPAIGACYEHMEYAAKELISARDPWSGWVYYDAGCAVLEHFAKYAELGWEQDADAPHIWRAIPSASACMVGGNNPVNGARHGEPSYITLAAPDGSDFSTVIVNDSAFEKTYRVTVDERLGASSKRLEVWQTKAALPGEPYDASWRRHVGNVSADQGVFTITVLPWSMVTATTLTDVEPYAIPSTTEGTRAVLDVDADHGLLYADDFSDGGFGPVDVGHAGHRQQEAYLRSRGGDAGASARYTTDTNGAFEIVPDRERGHVLRQQIDVLHAGNTWIEGDPRTAIGDMRWTNYRVSVDVKFEDYAGRAPYVLLGAREMGGDKFTTDICGYDFKLRADGIWLLRRYGDEKRRGHFEDLRKSASRAGKQVFPRGSGRWFTLTLAVAGACVSVWINGALVTSWTDECPQSAGRVNLGTSFDHVRFSNLRVERVKGFSPYYTSLIDDMHMVSWDDSRSPIIRYDGDWLHLNGQGMFTYMRSISKTSNPGSSVTHTFLGTGLDVFGPSNGSVHLNVIVDGKAFAENMPTMPTGGALRTQLRIEGLPRGKHTVMLQLANHATWSVDALGVLA